MNLDDLPKLLLDGTEVPLSPQKHDGYSARIAVDGDRYFVDVHFVYLGPVPKPPPWLDPES